MSIWRRIESSLSSTNGVTGMIPALLITTSTGPSWRSASSRKAAKEPRSVTSSGSATVPPPSCRRGLLGQLEVEVADRDAAALADQRRRRRLADPPGTAGDRHDLAAQ